MKSALPVTITKMSGAGNTFALVDARSGSEWEQIEKQLGMTRREFAKKICDSVEGVCTDGLLFIQSGSVGFDFDWDFYNSDGSSAEMCGNAARCAARYCFENINDINSSKESLKFKTGAGLVEVKKQSAHEIQVRMTEARFVQEHMTLKMKSEKKEVFAFVNTGVPHLVQKVASFDDVNHLKETAREARSHQDIMPGGANVTYFSEENLGTVKAVTFERGVEDYTLACGTGAVAAALVYSKETTQKKIEVQMPGGVMHVVFSDKDSHPLLIGDAVFVGDFKINTEVIDEKF